ncbi:hypothetical protein ACEWY4_019775 [Coilia grayii]|uniref:Uncharacterized protein n=1 Tax=Coilia grayii TaxID=363190 RepID=A0ABD1JAS7_9TELE
MPQIMTMSGQQTLSAAPLDLRTSTRGRESSTDSTSANASRPRNSAEVKAELPVHRGDCMIGSRTSSPKQEHPELSLTMTPNVKTANTSSERTGNTKVSDSFNQVRIKPESAAEDTVAAKSQDASASRLPFRKRPYPAGSETPAQSSTGSSKDCTNGSKSPKLAVSPFRKTNGHDDSKPQDVLDNNAQGITRQLDPQIFSPYALCSWPVLPHAMPAAVVPSSIWQAQMERLHADVALATQQDDDGDTPLHIAVVQGHEEMVHRLIRILKCAKKDMDIYNNMRQTPLHLTVITGHVDLVRTLLNADADPGALDRNGQNALHLCCEYNHASCLSAILLHPSGASASCLETRNYEGLSPLHLAVQSGNKEQVKLLLKHGADINAVDNKSGRSPLMHAVEADNMAMVNLLIEYRCDVNAQSYSGNTALHSACGRGHIEAVRTLLKNGADSSLKNYHNDTAVMVAKNKRVTDVLRGKGSRSLPLKTNDIQNSPQHNTSHARQFGIHGSSSPQYIGCSPVASRHTACHSPLTPMTHSPLDAAADSLSNRQSPMEVKDTVLLQKSLGHHSVARRGQFPPRIPQSYLSIYPGYPQPLSVLMPTHPAYSTGLPGSPYHQEGPLLVLPGSFSPQIPFFPPAQTAADQSRSSSCSSDQSDVSTMSVNSDSKGESYLD